MSAHALQDWKAIKPKIERYFANLDERQKCKYMEQVTEVAQKFLLPDNGLYFDDRDVDNYVGDFHLPFRHVACEFSCDDSYGEVDKIIVVAGEMSVDSRNGDAMTAISTVDGRDFDHQGQKVAAIFVWMHASGAGLADWIPIPMMAVLEYSPIGTLRGQGKFDPHYHMWGKGWAEAIIKGTKADPTLVRQLMASCLQDGILVLLQMCSVLNCSNVRHEEIREPKFINMKRAAKGKPKLDAYRILTVDDGEKVRHEGERSDAGWTGVHRRQHVRRGHIRRYQTGRCIWINQMVVGRAEFGKLDKDYKLRKTRHR
jgi:hypothetical protein